MPNTLYTGINQNVASVIDYLNSGWQLADALDAYFKGRVPKNSTMEGSAMADFPLKKTRLSCFDVKTKLL